MAIAVVRSELSAYDFAIRSIRETVFVTEQGVPVELEMDERDAVCKHVLALVDDYPAGTARLDVLKDGKIGRLAVLTSFRRRGLGRLLMQEIEAIGHEHQLPYLWCHAQKTAVPFYQSIGYSIAGSDFIEAGILHCKMKKHLGEDWVQGSQ
ncbi:gnat family acetyltransferase [Leptolyngbya sp. Heron Island J]|uniref:GNAT family N-acetyltransferase n=1 Tax=Leptolyngbya sp. Heron Island J TaxID=1385935 RepID=UPI0003B9AE01|nr:GNAT family N-acetyltransferase [Leptolyngbya sp. Heron Island J]ESA34268.1 gnat family acetyltransferase [Leptolyngbya sp. Heron Island J]